MRKQDAETTPKPTAGMPRSLLYAMIPIGFILLVVALLILGFWTRETTEPPGGAGEEPTVPANQTVTEP